MRQKLQFLLMALAFLLPVRLSAFDYKYEGVTLRYEVTDEDTKTCMVSGYNDFSGALVIPEVANDSTTDYSVTSIGRATFWGCSGLTSVAIPNSVTEIRDFAFCLCSGLISVEIPNSVTEIGLAAFSGCSALKKADFTSIESLCNITFGSYEANPLYYAHCLYIGGKEVTEAVIPETITSIGKYTFYSCSGLTSVEIPNSVTEIGVSAFYGCSCLTSVSIPNSVTEIGVSAFSGCSGLTSVEIQNSVTSIGEGAFYGCSSLKKAEFSSIESLCNIAFGRYESNPLYYAQCLYIDGKEVTEVVIPETVTSIGKYTFIGCSDLTSVEIPNSVTEIGQDTFRDCKGLEKAEFSSIESLCNIAFGSLEANPLYYAHCLYIDGKEVTEVVIPETVNSISCTFSGCIGLTSIVIPNSVTSIGEYAFDGCSGLTSVEIPNSITEIGQAAFRGCSGLKKAEFSSIESLCNIAFDGSDSNPLCYAHCLYIDGKEVTEVVIPETVNSISCTFSGCNGLTSIVIPNSVTSIGDHAFYDCSGLTSVVIPNSVTEIGDGAFNGCSGLTSVVIPNSVTEIGRHAFSGCNGLTSVEIPNSVTEIGVSAFIGCIGLTSVEIPNSVTSISNGAFSLCSGLTSVVIPNSVTSIGDHAFYDCSGLDTIIMGYGVETIDNWAFNKCPASNIYITAQTAPRIWLDPFSNYNGILHLQGKAVVEAYSGNFYWGKFNNELMIEPTSVEIEGVTSISGNPGDTFRLKATMTPADVTLPYVFWRSTNPGIATVDNNGLVTLQESTAEKQTRADGEEDSDGTCKIIAESLYFDGPIAEITVNNTGFNGVDTVIDRNDNKIDYTLPYDVYNMNGLRVSDTTEGLSGGIYIIRQGNAVVKTVVKQ